MRSFLVLGLLVGLFVSSAGIARAGDFGIPLQINACGEVDIAEDAMEDPSTAFLFAETPEMCLKLCKRSRRVCHVAVNDVMACYLRYLANIRSFGKLNCESTNPGDSAAIKTCKQNVSSSIADSIVNVKVERTSQHGACEEWGGFCDASCAP